MRDLPHYRSPYLAKCKRLRTDGPTPCLCCPTECVGDAPGYTYAQALMAKSYAHTPAGVPWYMWLSVFGPMAGDSVGRCGQVARVVVMDRVRPREVVVDGRIEDVVDCRTLDYALDGRPYPHPPILGCGCTACVYAFTASMQYHRQWGF
jgi:hypothetical protein